MITSEAFFEATQASLVSASEQRFTPKTSPLIPVVHCLADLLGPVRLNHAHEQTQDSTNHFLLHRGCAAQFICYA